MESGDGNAKLFVTFVPLFSDKTATLLESTASVAYLLHIILLNVSARKIRELIENGNTLVNFLPVRCTQKQLENEERAKHKNVDIRH